MSPAGEHIGGPLCGACAALYLLRAKSRPGRTKLIKSTRLIRLFVRLAGDFRASLSRGTCIKPVPICTREATPIFYNGFHEQRLIEFHSLLARSAAETRNGRCRRPFCHTPTERRYFAMRGCRKVRDFCLPCNFDSWTVSSAYSLPPVTTLSEIELIRVVTGTDASMPSIQYINNILSFNDTWNAWSKSHFCWNRAYDLYLLHVDTNQVFFSE